MIDRAVDIAFNRIRARLLPPKVRLAVTAASEHKAVAFDVYRAVGGSDALRRAAMDVTTLVFLGGLALGSAYSAVSNSSARDLPSLFAGLVRLPRCPLLSAGVLRRVRA
jgi:uncharacterized protein